MSHLDFSIPATWVANSYIPLTFLLLFLLVKIGAQRSVIKAHERLEAATSEVLGRCKKDRDEFREKVGTRIAEVAKITIRAQRQMESDQAELAKCIAASKRKDHEIAQLRENVNRLVGNSGEVTLKTAASFARKQDTPLA